MNSFQKVIFCVLAWSAQHAFAQDTVTVNEPLGFGMDDSLSFGGRSPVLDLGQLGQWTLSTVVSGLGFTQSKAVAGNPSSTADFSNAQLLIQKNTGTWQFFVQTGLYSVFELGVPYNRAENYTNTTFGWVPQAYVSYVPDAHWSVSAGKLPAMGGYEATFSYQNLNIQRGLLWAQTNSVSTGIQVNHTDGGVSTSFTWNDGSYSGKFNWLGASVTVQANEANSLTASWVGAVSPNSQDNVTTPVLQNNSEVVNLIYKYDHDQWMVAPYLQYTVIPANPSIGLADTHQTYGAAVLVNYRIANPEAGARHAAKISLPMRLEYLSTTGGTSYGEPMLLYGPNSAAWSFTVTPTYQYDNYFIRLEASYVQAINPVPGSSYGRAGTQNSQVRGLVELGFLF